MLDAFLSITKKNKRVSCGPEEKRPKEVVVTLGFGVPLSLLPLSPHHAEVELPLFRVSPLPSQWHGIPLSEQLVFIC